jgi:hypothetical protein
VGWPLLASVVVLISIKQDLGLRVHIGAALGSLVAIAFVISALVTAIRVNLRGGVAICAVALCFEAWLILHWILRRGNKGSSR